MLSQRHIAVPTAHVKVGVIKILIIEVEGDIIHQAFIILIGHKGGTGIQRIFIGHIVGNANIGNPDCAKKSIDIPAGIGGLKGIDIELHGAKGAAFTGIGIHQPHQKPQLSHISTLSIDFEIASKSSKESQKSSIILSESQKSGLSSSSSGIQSSSLSLNKESKAFLANSAISVEPFFKDSVKFCI